MSGKFGRSGAGGRSRGGVRGKHDRGERKLEAAIAALRDARAFAERNLVLLLRHDPTGVDLDVSLGWTGFEQEALAARTAVSFGALSLPMTRPEDLLIFKAMAARPKDLEDAAALLALHPGVNLERVRARLGELARLVDAPELVDGLEEIVLRSGSARRRKRRPPAKQRRTPKRR